MKDEKCKCGSIYIVNKKYNLCQNCNHERLHGETHQETLQKQQKKYVEKYLSKPKSQQQIKPTAKYQSRQQKLSQVKKEIELEAIQDGSYYCKGCGSGVACDKSHILSIKDFQDLELDKENIDLLCRKCHEKWESRDIQQILTLECFDRYMEFMSRKGVEWYNKFITKMIDYQYFGNEEEQGLILFLLQKYKYVEEKVGV